VKKRCFSCFVALAFVLVLSQVSLAQEKLLGQVTACTGEVELRRAKETVWAKAQLNMPVYFGDHIRTGKASKVTITFTDQSLLEIQSDTRVALNTIISPVEKKHSVLLFFGRIWSKLRKRIVQMRGYEVQTPTAVLGVRGTEFEAASYEDGTTIVRVDSGEVVVDSETDRGVLSPNQGTQLSFDERRITVVSDFRPEWEREEKRSRGNLFADGRKYGGFVHREIHKRRDNLKALVDEVNGLKKEREGYLARAKEAKDRGDNLGYDSALSEVRRIDREIVRLNKTIAFSGRRLECQFGLFSHYGYLAKHPELSKKFQGKEFILAQLDNIEMIRAEFDAMIEEGMKLSMKDMEDLMKEMKDRVKEFREKGNKRDPFEELEKGH